MKHILENPSESNHDDMRNQNHKNGHAKCRINIRIYRTEIRMKPWSKSKKPIHQEAIEISTKDIEKDTPYKPECF